MVMSRQQAFTLFELLITLAVIGIAAAIAVPAYRYYIDTANMSKVNSAYENAIRIAQQEFVKNQGRIALGLSPTLPQSSADWGNVFDPGGTTKAPGGGPIYDTNDSHRARNRRDDNDTGAIQVYYNTHKGWLDIYRPAYLDLIPLRARVTESGVEVQEL